MYRHKMEAIIRKEMENKVSEASKELYRRLSRCVDRIHVEKVKRSEGDRQMLMNLSCLVPSERLTDLEAELNRIRGTEGYALRLVGPLPPYSFC